MTVKGNFANVAASLAAAEHQVATFLVENPEVALTKNVRELADATGTSPATVSRVARSLSFNSYSDLKMQLAIDLQEERQSVDIDDAIAPHEDLRNIKLKLLANAERSLKETVDQVHDEELDAVIPLIRHTQHLLLFGVGASNLVAQNIAQKWSRLGYACTVSDDLNVFLPPAMASNPENAVVWLVSNSGESPEAVMAAKLTHQAGLPVIALTKIGQNSLIKYADYVLQTSQPLEGQHRFAATQSLHAQFMLVDLVYYAFVSRYYDDAARAVKSSREAVAEYKRSLRNGFK